MPQSKRECDLPVMRDGGNNIVLFYPHVPPRAKAFVAEALDSRWIGQGPRVEQFAQTMGSQPSYDPVQFGML
ncbi:MAG: hypothetical protein R6U98_34085 [Pirellulaceae bacterium]